MGKLNHEILRSSILDETYQIQKDTFVVDPSILSALKYLISYFLMIRSFALLLILSIIFSSLLKLGNILKLLVRNYRISSPAIIRLSLTHHGLYSSNTIGLTMNKNFSFIFTTDVQDLFNSDHLPIKLSFSLSFPLLSSSLPLTFTVIHFMRILKKHPYQLQTSIAVMKLTITITC